MNRNTLIFLLLLISNVSFGQDLKLWYSQPARNWSEALPIGNSRLGAMVYGGTEREELQLNEETVSYTHLDVYKRQYLWYL